MNIPPDLQNAIETGNCVLFIGAGLGFNTVCDDGKPMPDSKMLAEGLSKKFKLPNGTENSLIEAATYIDVKLNERQQMIDYIRGLLKSAVPDDSMQWIPTVKWKAIYTTNYDNTIEKAYDLCANPIQQCRTVTHVSEYEEENDNLFVPIIHLHGCLFTGDDINNIIITSKDYIHYARRRNSLFELLKICFVKNSILFIGYSHTDSNFEKILQDISEEIYPNQIKHSYRIDPVENQIKEGILEGLRISTLNGLFSDFVAAAKTKLTINRDNKLVVDDVKKNVPSVFWDKLNESIVPVNRFFISWVYVNKVALSGNIRIFDFVRGSKASWDLIFGCKFFRRVIEDGIFEKFLDYATRGKQRVDVCTITGSAGYGITTLMMILASRIAKEEVGRVFFLKEGTKLNEGDIFFADDVLSDNSRCFFFIDNIADYAYEIKKIIRHSQEQKRDIIFIIADRQNELANKQMLKSGDLFLIEPLCDSEIECIIDYLGEHNELNKLKHLDRADQIAAIKRNYNRELLVTIREATEGKSFDAIIQDEYVGIGDNFCQEAYKVISCMHQFDVQMRMELLTSILGVSEIEFYERTKNALKGIVHYDIYNSDLMKYTARTRHRYIAKIVWTNITKAEKETIIIGVLEKINIVHLLDRNAFEQIYRSEELIDSLPSLESRIRFFNSACRIDPDNVYVRQHYARMLIRNEQDELALSTINTAIEMDTNARLLHHTKGYILHQMMKRANTLEIGRKRRAQSEEEYRITIRMKDNDSYGYQGISELFIDWAKKTDDSDEEELYLAKAEEILTEALSKVPDKETIWVELSKIDNYLCNTPGQIEKLKRAYSLAPDSSIALHFLAKALAADKKYDDAIELFQSVFQKEPYKYRNSIEYAKTIVLSQNADEESIRRAIAILYQSTLLGYSDQYFIAILGGLLFLDKKFDESEKVFYEIRKRELQYSNHPLFIPNRWGINRNYYGTVQYVGIGHAKILLDDYCEVTLPYSKIGDMIITRSMRLSIDLVFNQHGALATIIPDE